MSKPNEALEFMLGMTHEEFDHWVWCGEYSDDNVVELHKEALRLRKELEEAHDALHKIADGEWEESMDGQFNDVFTTRTINPAQIANEALALVGQEGEGNQ